MKKAGQHDADRQLGGLPSFEEGAQPTDSPEEDVASERCQDGLYHGMGFLGSLRNTPDPL